jgi:hypothetical protein
MNYTKSGLIDNNLGCGYNGLLLFVADNNIELIGEHSPSNVKNNMSVINGKCLKTGCNGTFSKTFKSVKNSGACCPPCSKLAGEEKKKNTCQENYGCGNVRQNAEIKKRANKTLVDTLSKKKNL